MKTFAPPTSRSLEFASGSLGSPMGKLGTVGTPEGGGYTRMDAIRNSQLQRRLRERKDDVALFKAKLMHKPTPVLNGQPVVKVTRISAAHLRVKGKLVKRFNASGIGTFEGDIEKIVSIAREKGYSHIRTGVVTRFIG